MRLFTLGDVARASLNPAMEERLYKDVYKRQAM